MNIKKIAVIMLAAGFLISSCGALPSGKEDKLDGTSWDLLMIGDADLIPNSAITIVFEDGNAGGSSGCNSYSSSYEIDGNGITFGPIAATLMACMEPEGLMEQEQAYFAFLSEVVSFKVEGDQLILMRADRQELTFQKSAGS